MKTNESLLQHGADPSLPTLSVVIPTRNRAEMLSQVIERVLADNATTELIIVDDGSTDDTAATVERWREQDPRVRLVAGPCKGGNQARDAGAVQASGEVILMLDDDVFPSTGMITGHAEAHHRLKEVLVFGYMPVSQKLLSQGFAPAVEAYNDTYETVCDGWRKQHKPVLANLWMGNVSIRRTDWERVSIAAKVLPRTAPVWRRREDQEFGFRCWAAGLKGVFMPELHGEHHYTRSLDAWIRNEHDSGVSNIALSRYYPQYMGHQTPSTPIQHMNVVLRGVIKLLACQAVYPVAISVLAQLSQQFASLRMPRLGGNMAKLATRVAAYRGAADEAAAWEKASSGHDPSASGPDAQSTTA
ncbi:glycosyltransferase family 2 protein [Phycisphaerales bacterium AB-hyl4]|uniref:Glycosyltransferase family 2 protein n=1 Tax=Natronomicrosphaera hydrolytica TaxID=3242702 RepID=A0ABV4U3N3_9BACT